MLTQKDEQIINDLRMDFKLKWLERIIKQFITESTETMLLRLKYQSNETNNLLTIEDIANRFKISKATVHNWKNKGIIKGTKVGKNRYFTKREMRDVLHYINIVER